MNVHNASRRRPAALYSCALLSRPAQRLAPAGLIASLLPAVIALSADSEPLASWIYFLVFTLLLCRRGNSAQVQGLHEVAAAVHALAQPGALAALLHSRAGDSHPAEWAKGTPLGRVAFWAEEAASRLPGYVAPTTCAAGKSLPFC